MTTSLATAGRFGGIPLNRPLVMGVINVTPDSFSDAGETYAADAAVARGLQQLAEGADILDVGGESTRPGAAPVDPAEESKRIVPVVSALARAGAVVSIDTRHVNVMQAALDNGARIINDVTALSGDPRSMATASMGMADIVLMHMPGDPQSMMSLRHSYDDVVADVLAYLRGRIAACVAAGIPLTRLAVDPGFGFGKSLADNERLLEELVRFRSLGCPVLVGLSRKFGKGKAPNERLAESLALVRRAVANGADIVRVHDVKETVEALGLKGL